MTTDVTAADLAAALREALPYVVDLADYVREASEEGYRDSWESDSTLESVHRWQTLLDRWDAQERKRLDWNIIVSTNLQRQSMANARRVKAKYPNSPEVSESVERSRAANHRILALRRQLRKLGGDA